MGSKTSRGMMGRLPVRGADEGSERRRGVCTEQTKSLGWTGACLLVLVVVRAPELLPFSRVVRAHVVHGPRRRELVARFEAHDLLHAPKNRPGDADGRPHRAAVRAAVVVLGLRLLLQRLFQLLLDVVSVALWVGVEGAQPGRYSACVLTGVAWGALSRPRGVCSGDRRWTE